MDGTFEPIHKCVDWTLKTHASHIGDLDVCTGKYGCFGPNCCRDWCDDDYYANCGCCCIGCKFECNKKHCCPHNDCFRNTHSCVCASFKTSMIGLVVIPLNCVCMITAWFCYSCTNRCCEYEDYNVRLAAWKRRQPDDYQTKKAADHLGKDVGGIVGEYLDPPKQSMA